MKKYIMEFLGTFFLTFAVSFSSFTGNPIPIGLMLMAMIYVGFHISGSHYNPALSLAVFMRNKLSLEELGMYILAQLLGAIIALWFFWFVADSVFSPEIAPDVSLGISTGMEGLLTFVFCITALSVSMLERYKTHASHGVVIGLTLMAIAIIGGIFNPAIAGAALFWNIIKQGAFVGVAPVVVYIVGPLVGGAIAALMYGFLNEEHISPRDKNNIPLRDTI